MTLAKLHFSYKIASSKLHFSYKIAPQKLHFSFLGEVLGAAQQCSMM